MKKLRLKVEIESAWVINLLRRATATPANQNPPLLPLGRAAGMVLAEQFKQCRHWDPQPLMASWNFQPTAPLLAANPTLNLPNAGLQSNAPLQDIVAGLHQHCPALNAPLGIAPDLDVAVETFRNEVDQLLSAANRELHRYYLALISPLPDLSQQDFNRAARSFEQQQNLLKLNPIRVGKGLLQHSIDHSLNLLKIARLLDGWHAVTINSEPSHELVGQRVDVPLSPPISKKLAEWSQTTGVEKKLIVSALLACGTGTGDKAIQHLDSLLEFEILSTVHKNLRLLFNVFKDIDSRLRAAPCPQPDAKLEPFTRRVKTTISELRQQAEAQEKVIVIALLARQLKPYFLSAFYCAEAERIHCTCRPGQPHRQPPPDRQHLVALFKLFSKLHACH